MAQRKKVVTLRVVQLVPLRKVADYEANGWVVVDGDLRNLGPRHGIWSVLMELIDADR